MNTLKTLRDMERDLSVLLTGQEPDFEDIYHTSTDERLDEMYMEHAWTHNAPNTTPLFI